MIILAIDPGPKESAYVYLSGNGDLQEFGKAENETVMYRCDGLYNELVIEMIASYGMAVGKEVFETCVWIGRFIQASSGNQTVTRITRNEIKNHLCHSSKAKDSNIRAALIDRWGGPQAIKKGGALYKVSKDCWSALAVACTYLDRVNGAKL